ncbi:uncharacterized protein LOC133530116 [Cydia pomonella]|uniref:uncharacterized protein LOC133530116 n=1 Tax=Cydia pomonella TaxID=82600 RepID=UPI002ADD908B|nr:uncharacterized protein LOC133530116 [Cydia pomonella]
MQDCICQSDKDPESNEDFCSIYCKLPRFDWYWGNVTRSEVEYLLLKYPGNFIIRACNDIDHILCVSFRLDPNSTIKGTTSSFSHMKLKHYKGKFSLDKKEYVPVEKIPEHCERVGKETRIFNATVLKQDENTVLEMAKAFCKQRRES